MGCRTEPPTGLRATLHPLPALGRATPGRPPVVTATGPCGRSDRGWREVSTRPSLVPPCASADVPSYCLSVSARRLEDPFWRTGTGTRAGWGRPNPAEVIGLPPAAGPDRCLSSRPRLLSLLGPVFLLWAPHRSEDGSAGPGTPGGDRVLKRGVFPAPVFGNAHLQDESRLEPKQTQPLNATPAQASG